MPVKLSVVEPKAKAVTHHQVVAKEAPQGWHGGVYLDL